MFNILALFAATLFLPGPAPAAGGAAPRGGQDGAGPPAAAAASAEPEEATRLNKQVVRLFNEGRYDEALPAARRVLELREQALGGGHTQVASALNNLAAILAEKNWRDEAEALYRRSLEIAEKSGAERGNLAANISGQLGLLRFKGKDYKGAEGYFMRALAHKEKAFGAEHPGVAPALFNLADLYFFRGDTRKAEQPLERAVAIISARPPAEDPSAAARLKGYLCTLYGAKKAELAKKVQRAIFRLEDPEQAALHERLEKEAAEREARGEERADRNVLNGRALSKPQPEYPEEALRQRVMGTAVVKITVDETGNVAAAEAVCGHPLIAQASVRAARQARFTPTLLSGVPVRVAGLIHYTFVLR